MEKFDVIPAVTLEILELGRALDKESYKRLLGCVRQLENLNNRLLEVEAYESMRSYLRSNISVG